MVFEEKEIIYVAHPYAGKEENKERIDRIMRWLITHDKEHVYVSPINNFGMVYFEESYSEGLEICLNLLEQCDVLVLCGEWETSKGCVGEWSFAKARNKDIYSLDEWKQSIKSEG